MATTPETSAAHARPPLPQGEQLLGASWHRGIPRLLVLVDSVLILVSMVLVELLRFGRLNTRIVGTDMLNYTALTVILAAGWGVTLALVGSRDIKVFGVGAEEYKRVIKGTLYFFGAVAIVSYITRTDTARGYVAVALPVGLLAVLLGRFVVRTWVARRREQGRFRRRLLLVGGPGGVVHVHNVLVSEAGAGYEPVAAIMPGYRSRGEGFLPIPHRTDLSTISEIVDFAVDNHVEAITLTSGDPFPPQDVRRLGWELQERGISLIMAPALVDVAGPRIHMQPLAGMPLIHVSTPRLSGGKAATKRVFDLFAAGLGIVLISPLLLGVALAVRMDSPGPILFRQKRIGLHGKPFTMLKFRSMVPDAEKIKAALTSDSGDENVLFKMKDDPRITKVGRFIRRTSIDELPQLINVLRGDMSLVGPRPHLPHEVEQYEEYVHRRFQVQPGITGLWQVSGRSDLSWEDAVRLDLYYVENWSLLGDIVILGRTVRAVTAADGAY